MYQRRAGWRLTGHAGCVCVCVSHGQVPMPASVPWVRGCAAMCVRTTHARTRVYEGTHTCVHVCTPSGLQAHCTRACGHAVFTPARAVTARPPRFPPQAEGQLASGPPGADTPPLEGPGSPDSSECGPSSSCMQVVWISWIKAWGAGPWSLHFSKWRWVPLSLIEAALRSWSFPQCPH